MAEYVAVKVCEPSGVRAFRLRKGFGFQAMTSDKSAGQPKSPIEFDCRRADCGICIVRIEVGSENLSVPTKAEKDFLQAMHADPEERLACQVRIFGDVTIKVEPP